MVVAISSFYGSAIPTAFVQTLFGQCSLTNVNKVTNFETEQSILLGVLAPS